MFKEILVQNGLTDKEARLYLSVLEAGELTLARAAKKSYLKRSTVYSLVEGLKERGIISVTKRSGVAYLSALSPRLLIERFENSVESAKSILPQLVDLAYASPVKPRIHFYEGLQGIKDILFEAACSKSDYIGLTDYTLMPKEMYNHIRKKVAPRREKDGINLRILVPNNEENKRVVSDYKHNIEHVMVDFPSGKNHIEILLYGGSKVGFMSYVKDEMFGVVIDSKAIYQTLWDLFMVIWNGGKAA